MKIPAYKLIHKVKYPVYILEFLRCPDGVYAICVQSNPATEIDRVPQPCPISQLIIDENWIREEELIAERAAKSKPKTLNETK